MTAVLGGAPAARDRGVHFGCGSCGATLSVPRRLAGVSGACPLCGEWIESPRPPPVVGRKPGPREFVASRMIVSDPALATGPAARRTSSAADRGAWPARRKQFKHWFQQRQGLLSLSALMAVGCAVVFFASMGWKLPWQLSEDSVLVRLLDSFTGGSSGDGGGGGVPTHTRRR